VVVAPAALARPPTCRGGKEAQGGHRSVIRPPTVTPSSPRRVRPGQSVAGTPPVRERPACRSCGRPLPPGSSRLLEAVFVKDRANRSGRVLGGLRASLLSAEFE